MTEALAWHPPRANGRAPLSPPTAEIPGGAQTIEIVAPDRYCTVRLLDFAAPHFRAEIVSGPGWTVRLQPPAGEAWVPELLSLVQRWLACAPLPCATLRYGGRSYLIRASTGAAAAAESANAAVFSRAG